MGYGALFMVLLLFVHLFLSNCWLIQINCLQSVTDVHIKIFHFVRVWCVFFYKASKMLIYGGDVTNIMN